MANWSDRLGGWVIRHKGRIGILAVGLTAKKSEEFIFDWLIYGWVIGFSNLNWGPLWGSLIAFAIMAPLSAGLCYSQLKGYDWSKKDWLGLEALKSVRDTEETSSFFWTVMRRIMRMGDIPSFFILSIFQDPFYVTAYLRKGSEKYNGYSTRDWSIFWASVVFSNAYWTLQLTMFVELAKALWYGLKAVS